MKVSYKWLQGYFTEKLPKPNELAEILTSGAFEVENVEQSGEDFVLDIDVLPNRAHDCLSHRGIAREISTLLDVQLKKETLADIKISQTSGISVDIEDPALCRRYIGKVIENVKVWPSPNWLKERLESIGQKSINNIVDATNFVMFDVGQPLHAFDLDKLSTEEDLDKSILKEEPAGDRERFDLRSDLEEQPKTIIVRKAKAGEKITTLDEKEVVLNENNLVIADRKGALAIAGVKGGKKAEVDKSTTCIVLEAANFHPVSIRKTSRSLHILTDSSKRFENELTPELASEAIERVALLIREMKGNEHAHIGESVDKYTQKEGQHTITISAEEISAVLGVDIPEKEIISIYKRLGFAVESAAGQIAVAVPRERLDLRIKEDLVEEVGRVYGYKNIAPVLPKADFKPKVNKNFYYANKIRQILVKNGFSEVYNYTFSDNGEVELANPIAKGKEFLRTNLTDQIIDKLMLNEKNAPLLGLDAIRIFEFGNVFLRKSEYARLAIGIRNVKKNKVKEKEKTENILNLLGEELGTDVKGEINEGMSGGVVAEVDFGSLLEKLPEAASYDVVLEIPGKEITYAPISQYPFALRDIAVWVPQETEENEIRKLIEEKGGWLLVREPDLFDVFEKDGRVSYAFNLVFQSNDKTLTDEEVNEIMDKISAAMEEKGWEVR